MPERLGEETLGESLPAVGPEFPACSLAEVRSVLCASGAKFEMETVEIRGVPTRVWKNAPANFAELVRAARAHGDTEFMVLNDERVTYEAWFRAVAALAHALRDMGIEKGDRVALVMRNLPEWPVVYFAVTSIGAIIVPLNAWWTGAELSYGLTDSGAKLLVADCERMERFEGYDDALADVPYRLCSRGQSSLATGSLEDLIGTSADWADLPDWDLPDVDVAPDDRATILYTSGTTGAPKGALGTQRSSLSNILSSGYAAARAALRRGEPVPEPQKRTSLLVIPLFHATGCNASMLGTVAGGSRLIFMDKWDPLQAMEIIEREGVHATGGVPTIAWQLLEHPERGRFDLSSLEAIGYGGAPSAPELVQKIYAEFGALPGNGWGMTETCATVTTHSGEDYLNRPTSCGPPVATADLKIMDPDGREELPTGSVGELYAKGPMVVEGYWNKPEASAETFIDGWVRTGDLAYLDEEGFCFIVDRAKDIVIRGGENIYSLEVENALYEHPAVTDAAVVGIPHHTLGEEPAAVVHLAPGMMAGEDELRAFVRERLAGFKVPVRILFSEDTLPRNANGKILKKELKTMFGELEDA
ncbi:MULTISPECIES: class I adenylate-forming enzyme family protein [Pacificimonas]|nr:MULTISPECIES: class I adenylate-forming enzyme family protein [Pacificimonas]MBZ6379150.1 acyl--CoA ligase [Pacificimonas aurantium]